MCEFNRWLRLLGELERHKNIFYRKAPEAGNNAELKYCHRKLSYMCLKCTRTAETVLSLLWFLHHSLQRLACLCMSPSDKRIILSFFCTLGLFLVFAIVSEYYSGKYCKLFAVIRIESMVLFSDKLWSAHHVDAVHTRGLRHRFVSQVEARLRVLRLLPRWVFLWNSHTSPEKWQVVDYLR